jgi:hypothetical protein
MPPDGDDLTQQGASALDEQSSELEVRSEPDEQVSEDDRIEALVAARLSVAESRLAERFQTALNNATNFTKGQLDRLANEWNAKHGGNSDSLEELRETLAGLANPDDLKTAREKAQEKVNVSKLQRQLAEATAKPAPTQEVQQPTGITNEDFQDLVGEPLEVYAKKSGFTDSDIAAADFQSRVMAEAGDARLLNWSDWSPRGCREFRAAMQKGLDGLAQKRRNAARPQTRTPNPQTAGGGQRNYTNATVKDIPDDEFMANRDAIAAAVVAKYRR